MFVMLSVHTTTTVRERQADSVSKSKVNNNNSNQLYSTTTSFVTDNNNFINSKKQDLNLHLNNLKNNNNNNKLIGTDCNNKNNNIGNCQNCIKIATEQIVDLIPTTIGNGTSILIPSKLSASSPTLPPKFVLTQLNNYKIPPTVQVPVATILNDLSPIPAPVKVKNIENNNTPMSPMTPSGLTYNTPDIKAMRYYRLWIYTCNAVLLMAVIVFCGVAGKVLLLDYRRLLVNGLNLTQPSFIYAYLALLVQSGFLQLVGCLGALRLSEKLLNAYWLLLLVLLLGDAMLGIFWIYKFDKVMNELKPILRYRLAHEYGNSIEFTELWDRLQMDGRCCGVTGPQDFTALTNRTYPTSCCTQDITEQISITRRPMASAVVFRNDDVTIRDQHKNLTDIADIALSHVITAARGDGTASGLDASDLGSSSSNSENNKITIATCRAVYPQGCKEKLVSWLRNTADILFVIGYCVISFLKITFLGILRYEIKEMIQKIKLLQAEMATAILQGDCGIIGSTDQTQSIVNPLSINGGLQYGEHKVGNRDRDKNFVEANESERESLLVHENNPTPKLLKHKQLYSCINEQSGSGGAGIGGDLDTNSNCALIVEDIAISNPVASSSMGMGRRASYSIGTSQQPLEPMTQATRQQQLLQQQPTTSSATVSLGATKKTINGNNNYEMTDFDSKTPNYRRSNAPTVTKI